MLFVLVSLSCAAITSMTANHRMLEAPSGDMTWSLEIQCLVVVSFLGGYALSSLTGGFVAGNMNSCKCLSFFHIAMAATTALVPVGASYIHVYVVVILRFLSGIGAGVTIPCLMTIWRNWFPPHHRASLSALAFTGIPMGSIIASSTSEITCYFLPERGWTLNFYCLGLFSAMIAGVWWLIMRDSPDKARWMSPREKHSIEFSLEHEAAMSDDVKEKLRLPWRQMIKNQATWALLFGRGTADVAFYLLTYAIPRYLLVIKGIDFRHVQNDYFSEVPNLSLLVVMVTGGVLADKVTKSLVSIGIQRSMFQVMGCLVVAGLTLGILVESCEQWMTLIVLYIISAGAYGLLFSGYLVNHIDVSPRYCGILIGLTSFCGTVCIIIIHLTSEMALTRLEDMRVLVISLAAVLVVGAFVFPCIMSGKIQEWSLFVPSLPGETHLSALLAKHKMIPHGVMNQGSSQRSGSGQGASALSDKSSSCKHSCSCQTTSQFSSSHGDDYDIDHDYTEPKNYAHDPWALKGHEAVWDRKGSHPNSPYHTHTNERVHKMERYDDRFRDQTLDPDEYAHNSLTPVLTRDIKTPIFEDSRAVRSSVYSDAGVEEKRRSLKGEELRRSWQANKRSPASTSDEFPPPPPPLPHTPYESTNSLSCPPPPLIIVESPSTENDTLEWDNYDMSGSELDDSNDGSYQQYLSPDNTPPQPKLQLTPQPRVKRDGVRFKLIRTSQADHVMDDDYDDDDDDNFYVEDQPPSFSAGCLHLSDEEEIYQPRISREIEGKTTQV